MAGSPNKEKARRASANPNRPGENCRAEPGRFRPVVARNRCEGKHDCVDVCPYGVFEVRRMEDSDFAQLTAFEKFRSMVHGRKTSYTVHPEACKACGLCVVACPEKAIQLVEFKATADAGS